MAESAGPEVVAFGEGLVGPVGVVSDVVVVAAEGGQVPDFGGSAVGPLLKVVEVAVDGRHPTTGADAAAVTGFDVAALPGSGPPSGDAVVDGQATVGVGQSPPPLGTGLVFGDLAGDVGDDRPVPG